DRDARERRLSDWEGIAAAAAASALAAGQPDRAVELLERGRAVLWAQVLQTRDDFAVLGERDPELCERLRGLAAALEAAGPAGEPALPQDAHETAERRIRLADEWDRLVEQARTLPGLAHFLRTPPLAELRRALPEGPVVMITAWQGRCDALIVSRTAL